MFIEVEWLKNHGKIKVRYLFDILPTCIKYDKNDSGFFLAAFRHLEKTISVKIPVSGPHPHNPQRGLRGLRGQLPPHFKKLTIFSDHTQ